MSEDGRYLFSTSEARVLGFLRDTDTGYLSLAYGLTSESSEIHVSNDAHLWWNPLHERLVAADSSNRSYVLALPEDGSAIFAHQRMEFLGHPDDGYFAGLGPSAGTPDGRFFYRSDPANNLSDSSPADSLLHVYRVDSPTEYTLVQRVSPTGTPDEEHLVAPNMGIPVAMMLSPDGSRLYLLTQRGLMVFSADASSGRLSIAEEIVRDGDPDNPFFAISAFHDVTLDAHGDMLFVVGENSNRARFSMPPSRSSMYRRAHPHRASAHPDQSVRRNGSPRWTRLESPTAGLWGAQELRDACSTRGPCRCGCVLQTGIHRRALE